jgi:Zn-dependent M16 (insulinase) family peptidase
LATNGITYIQFGLDCSTLGLDLLPFLDLFATIATEIGTSQRDYVRFAKDINIWTGGFTHSFSTYSHIDPTVPLRSLLWFQTKALSAYLPQALDLVREVFADLNLSNRQRIKEIVLREFTWAEHSVQSEGYQLAAAHVFSHLSRAGKINEQVSGSTAYLKLKELAAHYDELEEEFLGKLEALRQAVLQPVGLTIAVTGSNTDIGKVKDYAGEISKSLTGTAPQATELLFPPFACLQAFTTSADVVYNVQGCNLFTQPSQYNGTFEVLKTWLSRDYLWNTVRQLGGAYGCFVQFHPVTGNFAVVSYRDPQVSKTYAAYDAIAAAVKDLDLSRTKLDQLIIGAYGSLNPLRSPAAEGVKARDAYLTGITPEQRQQILAQVIDAEAEALRALAPLFEQLISDSFRATIGSAEKINAHAELFDAVLEL